MPLHCLSAGLRPILTARGLQSSAAHQRRLKAHEAAPANRRHWIALDGLSQTWRNGQ